MKKQTASYRTVLRILKDTKPIAGWLVLGAFVSLISVALALVTPEILKSLSDRLYAYWDVARTGANAVFDNAAFSRESVWLAAAYAGSALASIFEMLTMNNVRSEERRVGKGWRSRWSPDQ